MKMVRRYELLLSLAGSSFILRRVSGEIGLTGRDMEKGGEEEEEEGGGDTFPATARNFSLMNAGKWWEENRGIGLWTAKWDLDME